MGSGKSTVGRLLTRRLGWRYLDNDDAVRALAERDAPDVIAEGGEPTLHAVEARALLWALSHDGPIVVAAAAGVIEDAACHAALGREARVVYLRARPETLRARIGSGHGRRGDALEPGWLEERADRRDGVYRALAWLTVDVDERSPTDVANLIIKAL